MVRLARKDSHMIYQTTRKQLLFLILGITLCIGEANGQAVDSMQRLSNGISLPSVWPPRQPVWQERHSMEVPYLDNPPKVITINTGRQLFVDDFLIASTNMAHVDHQPVYYQDNPVLEPDQDWEFNTVGPYAMPFSDGVWYDEKDEKYKMWYLTGAGHGHSGLRTAYAESKDGKHWIKPSLDMVPHTSVVDTTNRDAATIWLDKTEQNPDQRYKMFLIKAVPENNLWPMWLKYSSDGIHWSKSMAQSGGTYDRSTAFYNPFLEKWVLSMKTKSPLGRARAYVEAPDEKTLVSLVHQVDFNEEDARIVFWFGSDGKAPRNPDFPDVAPQIYNFDAMPYESLMIGYFSVWRGPDNDICEQLGIQKLNEVFIGYSRDGFHWYRPSHQPFLGVNRSTKKSWNWGNVQSVAGTPIIKGDSLYFYVSGRRLNSYGWDSYASTGLAMLRRDGFVSMQAQTQGYLLTRPVRFSGKYLFVNVDIKGGLAVEVIGKNGEVLTGYGKEDCEVVQGDHTRQQVRWKTHDDLSALIGKVVQFKFYVNNGSLYSFWLSPWTSGESRGYTAGGGPGLNASGIDVK